jgi:hypothetical protein
MEKKIIFRVECRLVENGRSAVAYFVSREDAQESLVLFRKRHGYESAVSIMEIRLEENIVDFTDRLML